MAVVEHWRFAGASLLSSRILLGPRTQIAGTRIQVRSISIRPSPPTFAVDLSASLAAADAAAWRCEVAFTTRTATETIVAAFSTDADSADPYDLDATGAAAFVSAWMAAGRPNLTARFLSGEPPNRAPTVAIQTPPQQTTRPLPLEATADDPDGDDLTYLWSATAGGFDDRTALTPTWTPPERTPLDQVVTLTLRATDPDGETAEATVALTVPAGPSIEPPTNPFGSGARLTFVLVEVQLDRSNWTRIDGDIVGSIQARAGITGSGPLDRVADPGTLAFDLDDRDGLYNPRRSNALVGWAWGTPIRLRLAGDDGVVRTRWTGQIERILPPSGELGERLVAVSAVDWMEHAASRVRPPIQRNRRADQILAAALDDLPARDRPLGRDLDPGSERYRFALHDSRSGLQLRTVLQRLMICEHGIAFVRRDGYVAMRNRLHAPEPLWTFDQDVIPDDGLELPDDLTDAYTRFEAVVHPLRVDEARVVLFDLTNVDAPLIAAGESVRMFLAYQNPDVEGQTVGADDLGGHTWTAHAAADGTGADLSGALEVDVANAGGTAITTVRNTGTDDAYLTSLQIRGRGIYDLTPVTLISEVETDYLRVGRYDMPYQSRPEVGQVIADLLLRRHGETGQQIRRLAVTGSRSPTAASALVNLEIADVATVIDRRSGAAQTATILGWQIEVYPDRRVAGLLQMGPPPTVSDIFTLDRSVLDGTDVLG